MPVDYSDKKIRVEGFAGGGQQIMSKHLSRAKISSQTSEMREWKSGLMTNVG